MASIPQNPGLPILYNDLVPLSSVDHAGWRMRQMDSLSLIGGVHAVPITTDEFAIAQRHMPIVFSTGPDPVPLALMGLNEGANTFVDENGMFSPTGYLPAYVRRYPFMLAKLQPQSEDMSLCFDPTSGLLGDMPEGMELFMDGQPSEHVKQTLAFCEQFEQAAQRTGQFMADLVATGLLEEGEVTISNEAFPQPYLYRGFMMINEERLRDLRGDQLRKMNQSGMLMLIHAHLFSLNLMTEIFSKQLQQGKVPPQA